MTIQTSIGIRDNMTAAFQNMTGAMRMTLNAYKSVRQASHNAMDTSNIRAAWEYWLAAEAAVDGHTRSVEQAKGAQQDFMQATQATSNAVGDLWNRLKHAVDSTGKAIQKTVGLSDKMAQTKARLSMVVDDGGSVAALEQQVYQSAQRSRMDYLEMADMVAKLSLGAGDAFSGNAETIQFAESLSKQFVIAGASQEEMRSASMQLTQALGSGVLQGEEFKAIFKAAPNVIQNIADYLDVPIGRVRDMASEGLISAEIVKNAMLSAADIINAKFDSMPMTWEQVWTMMKNDALIAFEPILQRINDIANSEEMKQFLALLPGMFFTVADVVMRVFDAAAAVSDFVRDNWPIIQPIVMGIVAALMIYKAVTTAIMVIQAIMAAINPFSLVLAGVAVAIALFAMFTEQIVGAIYWIGALGKNIGLWIANLALAVWAAIQNVGLWFANLGLGIWEVLLACAENIKIAFINAWKEMQIKFWGFVEAVLQGVTWIADKINSLLGVFGIEIDTSGLEAQIQSLAEKQKALEEEKLDYRDIGQAWDKGFHTFEYKDLGEAFHTFDTFQAGWGSDAYNEGAKIGAGIHDWLNNALDPANWVSENHVENISDGTGNGFNPSSYANNGQYGADTAANTGDTAANTARMADSQGTSEEELKLIREIAERQAIDKFTTAEVKIDMTGMTNKIENSDDIDGFLSQLTVKLEDALYVTAEGVHI